MLKRVWALLHATQVGNSMFSVKGCFNPNGKSTRQIQLLITLICSKNQMPLLDVKMQKQNKRHIPFFKKDFFFSLTLVRGAVIDRFGWNLVHWCIFASKFRQLRRNIQTNLSLYYKIQVKLMLNVTYLFIQRQQYAINRQFPIFQKGKNIFSLKRLVGVVSAVCHSLFWVKFGTLMYLFVLF